MHKDEDGQRVGWKLFWSRDIYIETLCTRLLDWLIRESMLNVSLFILACCRQMNTSWAKGFVSNDSVNGCMQGTQVQGLERAPDLTVESKIACLPVLCRVDVAASIVRKHHSLCERVLQSCVRDTPILDRYTIVTTSQLPESLVLKLDCHIRYLDDIGSLSKIRPSCDIILRKNYNNMNMKVIRT